MAHLPLHYPERRTLGRINITYVSFLSLKYFIMENFKHNTTVEKIVYKSYFHNTYFQQLSMSWKYYSIYLSYSF